jgi:hypothetical protein
MQCWKSREQIEGVHGAVPFSAAVVLFAGQKIERKSGGDTSVGSRGDKVGVKWTWIVFRPRGKGEDPAMAVQEPLLSPNQRRKEGEHEMTAGPAAKQQTAKTPSLFCFKALLSQLQMTRQFLCAKRRTLLQVSFWEDPPELNIIWIKICQCDSISNLSEFYMRAKGLGKIW